MTDHNGYQPTQTLDPIIPPSSGPAYKPKSPVFTPCDIYQLQERIRKVEAELRQAHGKISKLERLVSSMRAELPEGSVTDDDQPDLFDWEEES